MKKNSMTQNEKDKLWCDYMVTRLSLNTLYTYSCTIVGIDDFSKSISDYIWQSKVTGLDNFQSWNWKWGNRVFKNK